MSSTETMKSISGRMKRTLDRMDKKPKPEKPAKHPKPPEREHKPRPMDDDAMPPIITPDLPS